MRQISKVSRHIAILLVIAGAAVGLSGCHYAHNHGRGPGYGVYDGGHHGGHRGGRHGWSGRHHDRRY